MKKMNVLAIGIMALLVCAVGLSVALASDNVKIPAATAVSGIPILESVEVGSHFDNVTYIPITSVGGCDCTNETTEPMSVCPDDVQPIGEKVTDDGTRVTYSISGTLVPNERDRYGSWYFSPCETITISIGWTPPSSSVDIGICEVATGICRYVTCPDGACSHEFHIDNGGYYYAFIRNRGPSTIHYNGYLTI